MGFTWKNLALCVALTVWVSTAGAGTLYVDDDAPPGGNGGSWETAFAFLQDALAVAVSGDEIWVAQGTYYPDRDAAHPTGTADRTASFTLKDGVALVGGYAGPEAPEPDERDVALYVAVLSGDIGTPGDSSDNSYHVLHGGSSGSTALVDGFTITAGNAGSTSAGSGGGIYCYSASPTLANCTIIANAARTGGGLFCDYYSSPTLIHCAITGNSATNGGGVYCHYSSSPILTNCSVMRNTSISTGGGAVLDASCDAILLNCVIAGNATGDYGGGVYCYHFSRPTLKNCVLRGNAATQHGGGMYCEGYANATLTNCTLTDNRAGTAGGMCCGFSSSPSVTNCILWANMPDAIVIESGSPLVTYSDVQGGHPGTGNINADPGFAFPGDVHLLCTSPCVDAGTNSPLGGLPQTDFDGQPRLLDGNGDGVAVADMGTYEFNSAAPTLALSATELTIIAWLGQPGSQTLGIRNSSLGMLPWTVACEADWLTADPAAGESVGEIDTVTLTAHTANLAHGAHVTTVWVDSDQAFNAPRAVTVVLKVSAALHVPGEYPTIQAAIDAATVPGDEVVIADGVYTGVGNKDLDLGGRAITVRSASGDPAACVIDCEGSGRGFYFHSGESATSVVQGLTVRNGDASGVYCDGSSSPTLTNCTITGNNGSGGGGVCCKDSSSPTLVNCTITGNAAVSGGGVHCFSSSNPTLANCTLAGNTARYGGGLYCMSSDSALTLTDCAITGNTAVHVEGGMGGGVFCVSSSPTLTNCTITGNAAGYGGSGGGVCWHMSSGTLIGCTIAGNSAQDGGGTYCEFASSPTLVNCAITANAAANNGGGMCYTNSSPTVAHCTIAGNQAYRGAGVYSSRSSATLTNSILWANTPQAIYITPAGPPIVTYCDVQGGWTGTGNIDADPGFAFPNDFRLLSASPCIDAGTNDPPGGLPPVDPDGQPRPLDGDGDGTAVADMGAYEFNPTTPTVALSATELTITAQLGQTGAQTLEIRNSSLGTLVWELQCAADWLTAEPPAGESSGEVAAVTLTADTAALAHGTYVTTLWVNADGAGNAPRAVNVVLRVTLALDVPGEYPTIQAAINAATVPGDEVVIADGVYRGAGNRDLDLAGRAITVRSLSGTPAACVLDCQGSGRGFYFHSGETAASKVQGLTIRNGSADPGAGVYCHSSSPTLTNCVIKGNSASVYGGGMTCSSFSNPTLTSCTIAGNFAGSVGGGVYCSDSRPTLANCGIIGNTAAGGGGMFCDGDSLPALTACVIAGNSAERGGAVDCWESPATLTNCALVGNSASSGGGALYCSNICPTDPRLTNCTITGNWGGSNGGALYCYNARPIVTNCILWVNLPQAIYTTGSAPVVTWCDVQGGYVGTGNIDVAPLFGRSPSPGADGQWGTSDDDYGDLHLTHGSPCIDAGDNAAVAAGVTTDLGGAPRLVDVACRPDSGSGTPPIVDMGAYEAPDDVLVDCNGNGVDDLCEVLSGASEDTNGDGIPDECQDCNMNGVLDPVDIVNGTSQDCNRNTQPDECDIAGGTSQDILPPGGDGIPDDCQADCNGNQIPDDVDLAHGTSPDCNQNLVPDECDINSGASADCHGDGIPDECQLVDNDCNQNFIPDNCEGLADCNGNGVWDTCELGMPGHTDCNGNGILDECDVAWGPSLDCNGNGMPDECDIADGTSTDCNLNGIPEECEQFADCNGNNIPDECDITSGNSLDCDANGVPDECEYQPDCNGNGISDACEFGAPGHTDCNANGVLDECDVAWGPSLDCNWNGMPDECDIAEGTSPDANGNGVPDECEACVGDLDCSGAVDFGDINAFVLYLSNYPAWQTTYAGCAAANGDIDGNGVYPSFGDINPFVTLLSTHSLPMECP